ncbi:MAG TPA: 50S ribosomal protein L35 [Candidatus Sumerlaeota bacterium]|nr:MAG: 50S ribosomal protein L35 [candidate division BRC1 bacterium ADurb.BinA292]HOE95039.1 50S ribosomal protein L35 [Candidatus Sumerlaeota bacterium]HOR26479.1 50S ribosomal protein L35 [Candidatus Sumerlaeota bacterium]HPK00864.1 50S ribosomal protein L35 [Candidatus Sumerlaeota bacterium]
MPKIKTKGGVKKRLKPTGGGHIKRKRCNHGHILTKKSAKRKRRLRQTTLVHEADERRMKKLLHI